MNWLARLQSHMGSKDLPTKTTETDFVVSVGSPTGLLENFATKSEAANDLDPDRYCWPHSIAMNSAEIDLFTVRVAYMIERGLDLDAAERLADRLLVRDREQDDRVTCLECKHLNRGRRCGNWQQAQVAHKAGDAQLPEDFVWLFQRCPGFKPGIHSSSGVHHGQA